MNFKQSYGIINTAIAIVLIFIGGSFCFGLYYLTEDVIQKNESFFKIGTYLIILIIGIMCYNKFFKKFRAIPLYHLFNTVFSYILEIIALGSLGLININSNGSHDIIRSIFSKNVLSDIENFINSINGIFFIIIMMSEIFIITFNFCFNANMPWNKKLINKKKYYYGYKFIGQKLFTENRNKNLQHLSLKHPIKLINYTFPNYRFTNKSLRYQIWIEITVMFIILLIYFH